MNVHVEDRVACSKQVADEMILSSVTTGLFDQILIEIDSCDVASSDETTDQGYLKVATFTASRFVRQVPEHLLAPFTAIVFALLAENGDLDVVDLDEGDDSTSAIEGQGADLCTSVVRDASLKDDSTDKVLTDHEDRLSDLMISRLRISSTLDSFK